MCSLLELLQLVGLVSVIQSGDLSEPIHSPPDHLNHLVTHYPNLDLTPSLFLGEMLTPGSHADVHYARWDGRVVCAKVLRCIGSVSDEADRRQLNQVTTPYFPALYHAVFSYIALL